MVLAHHLVFDLFQLSVWHCWPSKGHIWLLLSTLGRCLLLSVEQSCLLVQVAEIRQPIKRHHLVHVINPGYKVEVAFDSDDLITTRFRPACNIVLIILCCLIAELPLNHERERVRDLALAREHSTH